MVYQETCSLWSWMFPPLHGNTQSRGNKNARESCLSKQETYEVVLQPVEFCTSSKPLLGGKTLMKIEKRCSAYKHYEMQRRGWAWHPADSRLRFTPWHRSPHPPHCASSPWPPLRGSALTGRHHHDLLKTCWHTHIKNPHTTALYSCDLFGRQANFWFRFAQRNLKVLLCPTQFPLE